MLVFDRLAGSRLKDPAGWLGVAALNHENLNHAFRWIRFQPGSDGARPRKGAPEATPRSVPKVSRSIALSVLSIVPQRLGPVSSYDVS